MVALYDYTAQGPEDLEFSEGDTIDILGEGETLQVNLILTVLTDSLEESFKLLSPKMFSCFLLSSVVSSPPLHVSLSNALAVNEEWLEGHHAGSIGIFPSCFAYREGIDQPTQRSVL